MSSEAFVTLVTNDSYALGALVLAKSIQSVGTQRKLVALISNNLSAPLREILEKTFNEVILVEELDSRDSEHLRLLLRPELGITFTKINCWLLEQYTKCVFLDADCLVLRQIDDLFEREEFSAAHDAGWPDCFNSGVFVYRPSKETYTKLMQVVSGKDASFDGGDQGLLNEYFSNWRSSDISRHLPFTYNVTSNAFYSYLPAITRFRNEIRIIHFAGALKPWQLTYNPENEQLSGNLEGQSDVQRDFLLSWWRIMYQQVWPLLSTFNQQTDFINKSSISPQGQLIDSSYNNNLSNNDTIQLGSAEHRRAWETGHIDYTGRDSYSHIQEQLERNIAHVPPKYHPSHEKQTTPERQSTPDKPTSILRKPTKEVPTTTQIPQQLADSNTSTEEQHATPGWKVKSTIVTTHTQGTGQFAGPTVIRKTVTESSASSSDNLPRTTSNQQGSSGNIEGAKTANIHAAWLFDKLCIAITYIISLCYFMFLITIQRFNNSSIIRGNERSVQGATSLPSSSTTKDGKRVNK
ncbi:unnamed protein product [Rotaria sordida]|uniref:glycogenin glucosyltransferase n=1 Tax=Rotaria sordida TaxID=392033 RepID=A0A815EFS6_9BILA|nr:unnamed protein product [Rotaria sordida]